VLSFGNRELPLILAGLNLSRPVQASPHVLRRIGLGLTRRCNLHCLYCLSDAESINGPTLPLSKYEEILCDAQRLGASTLALVGEGEPLCFPLLEELLALAVTLDMKPVLFTNGTLMDSHHIEVLWKCGASVIVKLNSLTPTIHDSLVGCAGAYAKALSAVNSLLEYGFAETRPTRLGIESVIVRQNTANIPELWSFCRKRNIFPYFETLKRCGRASQGNGMVVQPDDLGKLFFALKEWDSKNIGICWEPHPPHVGFSCEQHYFSCFVRYNGDVSPCSGITQVLGNVNMSQLPEVLKHEVFLQLRKLPQHLGGRCGRCHLKSMCYGCRANAIATSGSLFGDDPDCWIES
jgi:radical SAM protein with 4Fe4S-binding SPASM domain